MFVWFNYTSEQRLNKLTFWYHKQSLTTYGYVVSRKDDKWTKHRELVSNFSLRIWQNLGTNLGPQTGYCARGF